MRLWLGVGLVAVAAATLGVAVGWAANGPSDVARTGSSAMTSIASGGCSKAEATAVVKRLGLSDPAVASPVYKVLCGAFTGPGSQTMVASIYGPDNVGMTDWAVFRLAGGAWQLLMKRHQPALLTAIGSDIREAVPIYREGDQRCCPSGGTRARIWHWNGERFTASAWKQVTPGTPVERAAFRSPSGGIECGMGDDGHSGLVECWTFRPPQKATLYPGGRLTICRGSEARCKLTNIGEEPTLRYGKQITVGRFRCLSLEIGVRCTVVRSGKGFLINRAGVSRVGP